MYTTTTYGTWNNLVDAYSLNVGQSIVQSLPLLDLEDFDLDAIEADYRIKIDAALPDRVALCGSEFIGPYYEADCDFDGYPQTTDGALDIKTIVDAIDFWAIVIRHDRTAVTG